MSFPARAAVSLAAAILALPAWAVSLRLDASSTWADNISRSTLPADQAGAWRHDAQLAASQLLPLATGLSLVVDATAGAEVMPAYSRNSAWFGGTNLGLRRKFGLGPLAPVLTADAGLRRRTGQISGDQSWIASGSLSLSQRINPEWRLGFTGDWEQAYAGHSTFDVRHHRLFATVAWDMTETWQLAGAGGRLWGDFDASASWATWQRALGGLISPAVATYYNRISWEVTDAYGPRWVTYRVNGEADFWWLQLSPAIGANTSLLLRYDRSDTTNLVKVRYRQSAWTLGLSHRF